MENKSITRESPLERKARMYISIMDKGKSISTNFDSKLLAMIESILNSNRKKYQLSVTIKDWNRMVLTPIGWLD